MKHLLLIFPAMIVLTGCATQGVSSSSYTKNTPLQIKNETQIAEPYSLVWDKLIKELSKSYYVINNIDKESRIINLSFSSTSPTEYVDCGVSHRTYKQGEKTENYNYDTAGHTMFKIATPRQEHPTISNYVLVKREPSLEGRTNVYLAPVEGDKTKTVITVNTRYILSINVKSQIYAEHISGNLFERGQMQNTNQIISFNTNKSTDTDVGGGQIVTCFAKGKLENEILRIVK